MLETDVLIIGCGVAGCMAALELAKHDVNITLITSSPEPRESSSFFAQEGLAYTPTPQAVESLAGDMRDVGGGLVNPRALDYLLEAGPLAIREVLLDDLKVAFDTAPDGSLRLGTAPMHSVPRMLQASDHVGKAVIDAMLRKIAQLPNIRLVTDRTAVDLITLDQHSTKPADIYKKQACVGAYVLNNQTGEIETWLAKETILATGGVGELYLHTTNSVSSRGDGIAMAHRAGARLMNLEYVQFHPTGLYIPNERRRLLTEMVSTPQARLVSQKGTAFFTISQKESSAAFFDGLARGIYQEMLKTGADHVWLDITGCDGTALRERYPNVHDYCKTKGYDFTKQKLPVVPAAHYHCGGVAVDKHGRTTVDRLRAIGEVTCTGAHGANRLPSIGLIESIVWGRSCGDDIGGQLKKFAYYFPPVNEKKMGSDTPDPVQLHQDWASLKQTMWNGVGPVRETRRLRKAVHTLRDLQWDNEELYERSRLDPELIGLRNALQTALLIAQAAAANTRSLGSHYREG